MTNSTQHPNNRDLPRAITDSSLPTRRRHDPSSPQDPGPYDQAGCSSRRSSSKRGSSKGASSRGGSSRPSAAQLEDHQNRSSPSDPDLYAHQVYSDGLLPTLAKLRKAEERDDRRNSRIEQGGACSSSRNAARFVCHACNRVQTPEWRPGPDGPGTLCNVCGLVYASRKRNNKSLAGFSSLNRRNDDKNGG
ncbi:hypothetical protein HYQ45_011941 [Verticillium longisporum]|nr:hypothetical protein HYQ44_010186 [Verticillium longisporum]KAG7128460.1 hypothetical protein HYQ45_011941 [Verticillium longisporum]